MGVNRNNAFERMNTVKKYYNKSGGREYIHFVVSFKGKQNADDVYEIAERIAMQYHEYQVLFAVHLNTDNTHIHFIVNTVCVSDGHKYSQSKSDMQNLKERIELIINQSGLLYDDIYEEDVYSYDAFEDDPYELTKSEDELYEPMIFYDKPHTSENGLCEPMIFYDELFEPMVSKCKNSGEKQKLIEGFIFYGDRNPKN